MTVMQKLWGQDLASSRGGGMRDCVDFPFFFSFNFSVLF